MNSARLFWWFFFLLTILFALLLPIEGKGFGGGRGGGFKGGSRGTGSFGGSGGYGRGGGMAKPSGSSFGRNAMSFAAGAAGGVVAYSLMRSMAGSNGYRPGHYEPGYGYGETCTNNEDLNGTHFGTFRCPLNGFPREARDCCGNYGEQFCCIRERSRFSRNASHFGLIVLIIAVLLIVIIVFARRNRQRQKNVMMVPTEPPANDQFRPAPFYQPPPPAAGYPPPPPPGFNPYGEPQQNFNPYAKSPYNPY